MDRLYSPGAQFPLSCAPLPSGALLVCVCEKVLGSFLAFSGLHYHHTELQPAPTTHQRDWGKWEESGEGCEKMKELTMSKTETNKEEKDGDRM